VTRVYLLRHGETAWNAEGNRYCGRTDVPLSDRGRAQARAAAAALVGRPLAAVVCSPLARGREMAELVAGGRIGVEVDPRLVEIDFGAWEGLPAADIPAVDPEAWGAWLADPASARAGGTGETGAEVVSRAEAALADLHARFPDREIAVVGHNTLNRLLLVAVLDAPLAAYRRVHQANGCVNVVEIGPPAWRLVRVNGAAHLGPEAEFAG
jgi:broad specificity phosphatase PhoE